MTSFNPLTLLRKLNNITTPQKNLNNLGVVSNTNKVSLVKTLLELDVVVHLAVAGLFVFLLVLVLAWKFNVIDYFNNDKNKPITSQTRATVSYTPKLAASSTDVTELFVNKQEVSIEKAFLYRPPKVQLTVNGQLKKEVFGYLPYWVLPKVDEIGTELLTSVSYFGLEFGGDGSPLVSKTDGTLQEGWKGWNSRELERFYKKMEKSRIRTYVTLKCFDADNIRQIVTNPDSMNNFISQAIYLMSSKNLDGVNLDFEYIGQPNQDMVDGFSLLVSNLNKEMKRQYPQSILTISTFATAASTGTLHDVAILANNSDALVIMGYDFATPNSANAGSVAPMDGAGYSLTSALSSYLDKVDPQKLILAVPYYGYDWPTINSSSNAQVTKETADVKILPLAEIMAFAKEGSIQWDENTLTPWYSYRDSKTGQVRVVHFENVRSLGIKYDLINQKNFQGLAIWALGYDGKSEELQQLLADKFANQ